ncbi:hypothetical protein RI129_013198 [Pyrocoelia pectoralis]|uniref:TGF-beta family profile domain-containing protein n=1 Tax=Pyrocoelia pectoralis TaxID=417401 RepID=A0AAN7ZGZ3_9COLE
MSLRASILKTFHTSMWNKAGAVVILVFILPIICEKGPSATRSNSINKLNGHGKIEDFTSSPQIVGCGACRMREEIKRRSLEVIKANLLKKMGFQTAPNVTGRVLPQVPSHILAMVEQGYTTGMQSDEPLFRTGPSIIEEEDDYHAKTEKVLSFAQPYPRLRHSWRGHDILHFTLSDNLLKYYVGNATLFVYVKGVERRPLPSFHLEVFKVYKNSDHPDSPGMVRIASKRVTQPLGRGDWVKIDITVMVSEWFKSSRDNYGFILNGTVNGRKVIVTENTYDGGSKVPFTEITTTGAKRRARRNVALICDDKMNEPLCCRYPLTVNFYELGMEFVIAPKSYEANYCAGECPPVTLQDYPHTHLLRMASPNSVAPCCTPRKVSAISMLYYDNFDNVIYGSLSGMVVDRCGCL